MTKAHDNFKLAINDAQSLLDCFDQLNSQPIDGGEKQNPPEALRRAALIMTTTAWETYIEDVATEKFTEQFGALTGSKVGNVMQGFFTELVACTDKTLSETLAR